MVQHFVRQAMRAIYADSQRAFPRTVWLDANGRFAAIATRFHILPLEGIRADLANGLPLLQASAVDDNMADVIAMRGVTITGGGIDVLAGATIIACCWRCSLTATTVRRSGR